MSQDGGYDQEWWFLGPPTKIDEMNGKLVRSAGPIITHVIQRFGGKPVFIAPTETYQSAERGVVDVINMSVSVFSSWKLWPVMPNMVRTNMFYINNMYTMNKAKFDKLRPEDQKAILEAGVETARWWTPRYEAAVDQQIGASVMRGGANVTGVSKAERSRLIAKAAEGWNDQIDTACGANMGPRLRAIFKKFEG
jgi:TRAP-type C4-dicarboxylate transport system substrate-binding protein